MKLQDLLIELTPAGKKAAKAGLVSLGFGYYGPEKGGEATHKSAEGGQKLYKLKKAYGQKIAPKKKTTKKKKKAEKVQVSPITQKVISKHTPKTLPKLNTKSTAQLKKIAAEIIKLSKTKKSAAAQVHKNAEIARKTFLAHYDAPSETNYMRWHQLRQLVMRAQDAIKMAQPKPKPKKKEVKADPSKTYSTEKVKGATYKHHTPNWTVDQWNKKQRRYVDPIIKGEVAHIYDDADDNKAVRNIDRMLQGHSPDPKFKKMENKGRDAGEKYSRQHARNWIARLAKASYNDLKELMEIQADWQDDSQYHQYPEQRKRRNKFLNELMLGKRGIKEKSIVRIPPHGLERGMVLDGSDAKKFLANFKMGKRVVLPPSGWSTRPDIARSFGPGGDFDPEDGQVAIVMRLKAKKGTNNQLIGHHCSNVGSMLRDVANPFEDEIRKNEKKITKIQKQMDRADEAGDDDRFLDLEDEMLQLIDRNDDLYDEAHEIEEPTGYDDEFEVIRPGGVGQRVVKVEKHIFRQRHGIDDFYDKDKKDGTPKVVYVIEMEDSGVVPRNLWKEATNPVPRRQRFKELKRALYKYINGTVGFRRKKQDDKTDRTDTSREES